MTKTNLVQGAYKSIIKPILFQIDAEKVHNRATSFGETLAKNDTIKNLFSLEYSHPSLQREVLGIKFKNPLGLAAGFDYDGHLARAMSMTGFGFNTVGTVTAKAYEGNEGIRLGRLPKSKALLVNKGFKSEGADKVLRRLDKMNLKGLTIGLSIGSSNLPEIDTIGKTVDDYLYTFDLFMDKPYLSYFELNVSCPNIRMKSTFTGLENYKTLVKEVAALKIKKPIFVKMPCECSDEKMFGLVEAGLENGLKGYIFSNLVKDRNNKNLDRGELEEVKDKKGNFSGKPAFESSNKLIASARKRFGKDIALIGCGGVFSAEDAKAKMDAGADLVQLITGMIYEGPQLPAQICEQLSMKK